MGVNICMFQGNLTRDPETHTFGSGAKVVRFSLAVNNRKKNRDTGEWENDPVFLDCEAWEKQGELIEQHFHKGSPIFIRATAKQENWEDKQTGAKRSKTLYRVEDFQFWGPKADNGDGGAEKQEKPSAKKSKKRETVPPDDGGLPEAAGKDPLPF